jgi:hypothetical protein
MNATTDTNWYFAGDFDHFEGVDPAEKVEAQIFVEKFKKDAPMAFEFSEPTEEQPFGSWTRKDDEFGGTTVILGVATGSDATNYDYPDGFEMWVYAGEGMELANLPADWSKVDEEIRSTLKAWNSTDE